MQIRVRKENDISALAEVLKRVHAVDGYPVDGMADVTSFLTKSGHLQAWTALDDDNTPIGQVQIVEAARDDEGPFTAWQKSRPEHTEDENEAVVVNLARLFVDPKARGQGAAGGLLMVAQEWADLHGKRMLMNCLTKDVIATETYRKAGWIELGTGTFVGAGGIEWPQRLFVSPVKA